MPTHPEELAQPLRQVLAAPKVSRKLRVSKFVCVCMCVCVLGGGACVPVCVCVCVCVREVQEGGKDGGREGGKEGGR